MEPDTMSSSKWLAVAVMAGVCAACHAKSSHRYECPSPLPVGGVEHALKHVDLFDGPPRDRAFLQAWDSLKGVDPYLVCSYDGTGQVVTIHAVGSKSCQATVKPLAAYCD